jgi:hypothetical protein
MTRTSTKVTTKASKASNPTVSSDKAEDLDFQGLWVACRDRLRIAETRVKELESLRSPLQDRIQNERLQIANASADRYRELNRKYGDELHSFRTHSRELLKSYASLQRLLAGGQRNELGPIGSFTEFFNTSKFDFDKLAGLTLIAEEDAENPSFEWATECRVSSVTCPNTFDECQIRWDQGYLAISGSPSHPQMGELRRSLSVKRPVASSTECSSDDE